MTRPRCHNLLPRRILITRMALVILLLILAGCRGAPPRIIGFDPPEPSVTVGDAIEIQVDYASNGQRIDYFEWRADEGEILCNGKPLITYQAPSVSGSYNISVELQYSGGTVEDSAIVKVVPAVASTEPTPTPTSTNTPTPIPTDTPTPTAVDTPTPTLAPIPTDTPTPTITLTTTPRPSLTARPIPPSLTPTSAPTVQFPYGPILYEPKQWSVYSVGDTVWFTWERFDLKPDQCYSGASLEL